MILESVGFPNSTFLTLTYDEDHAPEGNSVLPRDFNGWIDRLRHRKGAEGIRYFGCGEYGERTHRPHYHAIIFGINPYSWEADYADTWEAGHSLARYPNPARLRYVCRYVTKRMTAKDDYRLDGRNPEFARASRKPPLGRPGIIRMLRALQGRKGRILLEQKGDVPGNFRSGGRVYPVSQYWKDYLRQELGIDKATINVDWTVTLDEQEKARQKSDKTREFTRRKAAYAFQTQNV